MLIKRSEEVTCERSCAFEIVRVEAALLIRLGLVVEMGVGDMHLLQFRIFLVTDLVKICILLGRGTNFMGTSSFYYCFFLLSRNNRELGLTCTRFYILVKLNGCWYNCKG